VLLLLLLAFSSFCERDLSDAADRSWDDDKSCDEFMIDGAPVTTPDCNFYWSIVSDSLTVLIRLSSLNTRISMAE
jgi:hypothetical protein